MNILIRISFRGAMKLVFFMRYHDFFTFIQQWRNQVFSTMYNNCTYYLFQIGDYIFTTDASYVQLKTLVTNINSDVANLLVMLVIKYSMSNQKISMYLINEFIT
jgi:hypothetical protein